MEPKDFQLLQQLCAIQAPSGNELAIKEFLLQYIEKEKPKWKVNPKIIAGPQFQDCLILIFGKPKTAIFAHMDSVGYTVGYQNELLKIGGPTAENGSILVGEDSQGVIEGKLNYSIEEETDDIKSVKLKIECERIIDRGTPLTYKPNTIAKGDYIQSNYLDNRLGILNALKVAESLENGAIVFSSWEEVGGGSVGYLAKYLYEKHQIQQALISDITWVTNGVEHGKGVAISARDSGIPRRSFIERIIKIAKESKIPFQIEVEGAGGSDGNALQKTPYPFDWCFVGAPEDNVHSPKEKVHKADFESMKELYCELMLQL